MPAAAGVRDVPNQRQIPLTQLIDHEADSLENTRLLDRRSAAAYVRVTIGLFERLVREHVIPEPILVDRKPLWNASLLDSRLEAIRHARDMRVTEAVELPARASQLDLQKPTETSTVLPDRQWLEARENLVRRVQKRPLSQQELSLISEFGPSQSREVSMFGFYRTFESLMARGFVLEVTRSGPSSRPLVTYRLTEDGARIADCMRDAKSTPVRAAF
jgi:hypothetical protein